MKTSSGIAIAAITLTSFACGTQRSPAHEEVVNASDAELPATTEVTLDPPPARSSQPVASSAKTVKPAPTAAASNRRLSEVCETYWAMSRRCNEAAIQALPAGSARDEMKRVFEDAERQTRESWHVFEGNALDQACKTMIDALAQNPNCPKQ